MNDIVYVPKINSVTNISIITKNKNEKASRKIDQYARINPKKWIAPWRIVFQFIEHDFEIIC